MFTSPVASKLTERHAFEWRSISMQDVHVRKKDGLLRVLLKPITAVTSQENAAWNKDPVEGAGAAGACLVEMLNSRSTPCRFE
jgi:hypothetical protein